MKLSRSYAADLRETFRVAVLQAMDRAMEDVWRQIGVSPRDNCTGARDADLPALFPALDAQFERNVQYQGHSIDVENDHDDDEDICDECGCLIGDSEDHRLWCSQFARRR